jgi:hypothetical protein
MSLLTLLQSQTASGVVGTGAWTQAAASWTATGAESLDAVAAFVQAPASWQAADSDLVTATGEWAQQPASWLAFAETQADEPVGPPGGAFIAGPAYTRTQRPRIIAAAAFVQEPARWYAEMATSDDDMVLELLELAA